MNQSYWRLVLSISQRGITVNNRQTTAHKLSLFLRKTQIRLGWQLWKIGFCACEKISSNYSVRFSLALSYGNSSLLSGFILSSFDSSNANNCPQTSWHNHVNSVGTRNRPSCMSITSEPTVFAYFIKDSLLGSETDENTNRHVCLSNVTRGPCKNSSRPKLPTGR